MIKPKIMSTRTRHGIIPVQPFFFALVLRRRLVLRHGFVNGPPGTATLSDIVRPAGEKFVERGEAGRFEVLHQDGDHRPLPFGEGHLGGQELGAMVVGRIAGFWQLCCFSLSRTVGEAGRGR